MEIEIDSMGFNIIRGVFRCMDEVGLILNVRWVCGTPIFIKIWLNINVNGKWSTSDLALPIELIWFLYLPMINSLIKSIDLLYW